MEGTGAIEGGGFGNAWAGETVVASIDRVAVEATNSVLHKVNIAKYSYMFRVPWAVTLITTLAYRFVDLTTLIPLPVATA